METESRTEDSSSSPPNNSYVEDGKNKTCIYCSKCPSKILQPQIGSYLPDENFDLPRMTQDKNSPSVQTDPITEFFQVGDMFQFENVGFSNSQNNIKYLICADCEYGPIGYSKSDTKISYIAIPRVSFTKQS